MSRLQLILATVLLAAAGGALAQTTNDFATGGMHFSAKEMDTNHDGMISMDEMKAYGEKMWAMMAKDAPTIPVTEAAKDFARGNLRFSARAIDTDHDGTISKEEFMAYTQSKFSKMMSSDGTASVQDVAKAFSRGNTHPKASASSQSTSPSK
ncbi:MAG TPA: EF-hand domain-containing protein [Steroidobacteraceae bacterium]|nr:EF-hand domain-containing protein [Steroidobacteraceae bacterium]